MPFLVTALDQRDVRASAAAGARAADHHGVRIGRQQRRIWPVTLVSERA